MQKLNTTFKINPLYEADSYKVGHKAMLAEDTTKEYGTWIPRSLKYMPGGIDEIMSAGQQLVVRHLHSTFAENFFYTEIREKSDNYEMSGGIQSMFIANKVELKQEAMKFVSDISLHIGLEFDGKHFEELWELGYLPIKVKALPEGIFTQPNIPHMTFVNTVDGYAWLTLFLETYISKLAWQLPTAATIGHKFRQNANEWVAKTDSENMWLTEFMCHDFHSRGGNPFTSIAVGLGHALSNKGSDTLNVIPASRYYYDEAEDSVPIYSVTASEHSVTTTKIFTCGEKQMIVDWLKQFPTGILSIVADTFDLWKLITEYLADPEVKALILARDGKLVIRPDSGDPVDIICGINTSPNLNTTEIKSFEDLRLGDFDNRWFGTKQINKNEFKGVIELLWDIFGGTVNEQGYKVLDSHIGCIYGDSINLERQVQIYERLAVKQFAATNIVVGVGSFTYVMLTRDSAGYAAKGAWFEVEEEFWASPESLEPGVRTKSYNIYKDPVTDDGTKKSLKGLLQVELGLGSGEYIVKTECTPEEENQGLLQTIYENGEFFNQTTLSEIRERINQTL